MRMADDLGERRNLLVLHPDWIDTRDLWSRLREILWRRDFSLYEAMLDEMLKDCSPTIALIKKLGIQWPASLPKTPSNLASLSKTIDVIQLAGFGELPENVRRLWFEFFIQWSQSFQNIVDRGGYPTAFCLICPIWMVKEIPTSALYLSVRLWQGIPSALETQMLCRLAEKEEPSNNLAFSWRENILSSIAGSDVQLAEWLWDDVFESTERLIGSLVDYAKEIRKWSVDLVTSLNIKTRLGNRQAGNSHPKIDNPELWGRGIFNWTQEYGVEVNSAALALFGRKEDIWHRLWRAQASLLLPQLDSLRLGVCEYLIQAYGPEWPMRWKQFGSEIELRKAMKNPYSCQWGYLESIFSDNTVFKFEQNYLSLIQVARYIRNRLAHFQIIDYSNYKRLCREVQNAENILS